jgi:uncharacterized damage-inducible protein DinB
MPIIDSLLPEYQREMATTRAVLARVPGDRLDWKPHQKSMSLGQLAAHIAEMADWSAVLLKPDYDASAASAPSAPADTAVLLEVFDRHVASTTQHLTAKTDAELTAQWTVKRDGQVMFTTPRVMMLRSILLNHLIHHRGQITVYLRLNEVPLPPVYGPTADEKTA